MSLYAIKKEQRCIIENLPQMGLLKSLGLREGIHVAIKSRQPMGGPVIVQVGRRCVAIAQEIAEHIQVREVN
jgi:ferrous iron transport protein A